MRLALLLLLVLTLGGSEPAPLLVVLDAADPRPWEALAASRGWRFQSSSVSADDGGMAGLEARLKEWVPGVAPVYLVGLGPGAAAAFYAVSRLPDRFTAAAAIDGSPRAAIGSNRLFGGNTQLAPLLWLTGGEGQEPFLQKLKAAGFNLETRPAGGADANALLDWLASHRRDEFPASVDCETGSPAFPRCYWLEIKTFDPKARNDVLGSTRVNPGSGAFLDLGGFGFNLSAPGPGVEIAWLPPTYKGPLRLGDRIVSLLGKPIGDAREYAARMDQMRDEQPAAVMVLRNGKRQRIETRIRLPKREETFTARVQATWFPDSGEIQIVSRGVSQLNVAVAPNWAPVSFNWNGVAAAKAGEGGCLTLTFEPPSASPCR
jgi:hypothetical protein